MVYLAESFAERGFDTDLVLANAHGPYLSLVDQQVQIIDLNSTRVLASLLPLVRYLKREKPRAVLSTINHANLIAVLAHALAGSPGKGVVVRVANHVSAELALSSGIRDRATVALVRYVYPWADEIIAVSKSVADDLVQTFRLPPEKVSVVYNPALTTDLADKINQPLTHPWFAPDEPPVILAAGRLARLKDFPTLIKAFARIITSRPARLLILGEGDARIELERLINSLGLADQVELPGFMDNPFCYMAQSSLFVSTSLSDGMPNTLLQALACGTPVIATDCPGGSREILAGGKWGKLVPVGDVEALAEAMLASLQGHIQRPTAEELEKRFRLDAIVEQYLSLLV